MITFLKKKKNQTKNTHTTKKQPEGQFASSTASMRYEGSRYGLLKLSVHTVLGRLSISAVQLDFYALNTPSSLHFFLVLLASTMKGL